MCRRDRIAVLASLVAGILVAGPAAAQLPGGIQVPGSVTIPTSLPSKDQLLGQAKQMVSDLTSLKANPSLPAPQVKKVDELLPRANALTDELAKPKVETSRLGQLAQDLADLQKQVASLKSLVK